MGYSGGGSAADISRLKDQGTVLFGYRPDSQRYFDYHHSKNDVWENVHRRELVLGSAAMTALVYFIDTFAVKIMLINRLYILFTLGCLTLFGCRKEVIPYNTVLLDLPTEKVLNDICFVSIDTFLVCAGTLFEEGLILITTDGGQQFDTLLTTNQGINSIDFLGGQYSYSQSGQLFHRSTNLIGWNTVATLGWWQWQDHLLLPNGKAIIIGGENFGRGFIHTQQAINSPLIYTDSFAHQLRRITQNLDGTIFTVGYGVD